MHEGLFFGPILYMKRRLWSYLLLILIFLFSSCSTNPVSKSSQFTLVSEAQEIEMGKRYYGPTIQSFDGQYPDLEAQAYVRRIGKKLASLSHRPNLDYEFTIVNASIPNAFALPGGKICITRGLLAKLDNEAELASVLGHEIGHITARHGAVAMTRQMVLGGLFTAGAIALETQPVSGKETLLMAGAAGLQVVLAKYSREQETQADDLGLEYMMRAHYTLEGSIELFEILNRLQEREPNAMERMLASHPQSSDRLSRARDLIESKYAVRGKPKESIEDTAEFRKISQRVKKEDPYYQLHEKGTKAAEREQWDKAIHYYKDALKAKPNEALFHADLGYAYLRVNQLELSEQHLKQAVAYYADFFKPNYYLGYLYRQKGDLGASQHYFARANQIVPGALGE